MPDPFSNYTTKIRSELLAAYIYIIHIYYICFYYDIYIYIYYMRDSS